MELLKDSVLGVKSRICCRFGLAKRFVKDECGLGTVEVVIITAILVGLALIFREYITAFLKRILDGIFNKADKIID